MYGEEIYRTRTILPTACTSELILAMTLGFGQTKPTDNSAHHELLELILNSSFSALFEDEVLRLRLRFFLFNLRLLRFENQVARPSAHNRHGSMETLL